MSVSGQVSDRSHTFSYDAPTIVSVAPRSFGTDGHVNVSVYGVSFARRGQVTIGGAPCNSLLYSDSLIICDLPAGVGANQALTVTQLTSTGSVAKSSSLLSAFSYLPPTITSIDPLTAPCSPSGALLTVIGSSFGSDALGQSEATVVHCDIWRMIC